MESFNVQVMVFDVLGGITLLIYVIAVWFGKLSKIRFPEQVLAAGRVIETIGLGVLGLGLLGQAERNLHFLRTGHSYSDNEHILWVGKDFGGNIVALGCGLLLVYAVYKTVKR